MRLEVEHRLSFEYDDYISESYLELRVQPKTTAGQSVTSFVLAVGPPVRVARYHDWNDNVTHAFSITKFHNRIEVVSTSVVDTHPVAPDPLALADPLPLPGLPDPLWDFLQSGGPVRATPALEEAYRALDVRDGDTLGGRVRRLGAHLQERFEYQKDVTRYDSTTDDFLAVGAGVCQDFAHLMLGFLRRGGIPCRYVSGYLHVDRDGAEPAQSHAWVELYAPSVGWVPYDPTHHRAVDERYVVVGHGRHYDDVPPNRGIYRGGARETLRAEVRTRPGPARVVSLHEDVRQIDLQVFRELPEHRRERLPTAAEEAQAQQQQ